MKQGETRHNHIWERNHALLTTAYLDIVKATKRTPTLSALRDKTGISIQKISAHLKELDVGKITSSSPNKLWADDIIAGLAKAGAKGDPFAAKLYFQLLYKFNEKTIVDQNNKYPSGITLRFVGGISDKNIPDAIGTGNGSSG